MSTSLDKHYREGVRGSELHLAYQPDEQGEYWYGGDSGWGFWAGRASTLKDGERYLRDQDYGLFTKETDRMGETALMGGWERRGRRDATEGNERTPNRRYLSRNLVDAYLKEYDKAMYGLLQAKAQKARPKVECVTGVSPGDLVHVRKENGPWTNTSSALLWSDSEWALIEHEHRITQDGRQPKLVRAHNIKPATKPHFKTMDWDTVVANTLAEYRNVITDKHARGLTLDDMVTLETNNNQPTTKENKAMAKTVSITLDREEQAMARNGQWDWIKELILNALPAEPPTIVKGLKFIGCKGQHEGSENEVAMVGPDSENPRKVVYTNGTWVPYDNLVELFLDGSVVAVEDDGGAKTEAAA